MERCRNNGIPSRSRIEAYNDVADVHVHRHYVDASDNGLSGVAATPVGYGSAVAVASGRQTKGNPCGLRVSGGMVVLSGTAVGRNHAGVCGSGTPSTARNNIIRFNVTSDVEATAFVSQLTPN